MTDISRGAQPPLSEIAGGGGIVGGGITLSRAKFADQAYAHLFHRIVSGAFREGQALPSENDLCGLFGISRPVVRQALGRLRGDGLIESRQGSGWFVRPRPEGARETLSRGKLEELLMNLEFRRVIEPEAAYLAAQRRSEADLDAMRVAVNDFERTAVQGGEFGHHLDFAFHHALAAATGNHRFVEAVSAVEYDIDHAVNLARYLVRYDPLDRARKVLREHARMLEAVERQDAEGARAGMVDHLEQARIRMSEGQPGAG